MKNVLFDSSVWLSIFLEDTHAQKAQKLYSLLARKGFLIFLPILVYAEVMNNLIRHRMSHLVIAKARDVLLNNKYVWCVYPSETFWLESFEQYSYGVNLKTVDLLILAFAFEFEVDQLYSFDRRLLNAYTFLKSKNSK